YHFEISHQATQRAIMNFLLMQFMRFRSDHLETGLIGSKFIKSLNLILKYQMIYEFLLSGKINIPSSYNEMLERVTPQLTHLKAQDIISDSEWNIIKLQLLYYLKNIRFILCEKHPELKALI